MGTRPRLKKKFIGEVVIDELEYRENKGSKKARKIIGKTEQVHIEIWFDKHYIDRVQFGDNDGKREGIDTVIVESLVTGALGHLIHYAFKNNNFSFLNEVNQLGRTSRLVLQKETEIGLLNVAVGFYHIEDNRYEVTVFTAMVNNEFRISDGQYVVLINMGNSNLLKMDNKSLIEIDYH